jgi:hypothetical protein
MQKMTICKGKQIVDYLKDNIYRHINYDIKWIFLTYDENDFLSCLKKNNVNCLCHLNLYGLPIILVHSKKEYHVINIILKFITKKLIFYVTIIMNDFVKYLKFLSIMIY